MADLGARVLLREGAAASMAHGEFNALFQPALERYKLVLLKYMQVCEPAVHASITILVANL